jgi:hypothetical protein
MKTDTTNIPSVDAPKGGASWKVGSPTSKTTKRKPKAGELADPNSNRSKNKVLWANKKPKKKKTRVSARHPSGYAGG